MTRSEFTKEFSRLLSLEMFYKGHGDADMVLAVNHDIDILIKDRSTLIID